MSLNPSQKRVADTLEGMIVIDAGPGTGKTHTLVERYLNILKITEVNEVVFLTFTRNAAQEIKSRLTERIASLDEDELKKICRSVPPEALSKMFRVSTFDALCMQILHENPEAVSRFFDFSVKLRRDVKLTENETLNELRFSRFAEEFIAKNLHEYPEESIIFSEHLSDGYALIQKLLAHGIFPLKEGWFGDGDLLRGDSEKLIEMLKNKNGNTELARELAKYVEDKGLTGLDIDKNKPLSDEWIINAVEEDRSKLFNFIHDLYYAYICQSIENNNVTFGLAAVFAFIVLYTDEKMLARISCRYLMIDEFQDTNKLQFMFSLLLLRERNFCAVGDWRQSIYGFRNADVDNIRCFRERVEHLLAFINTDKQRVDYSPGKVKQLAFDVNYRSSQKIIDLCFKSMDEEPPLTADREGLEENSEICFVQASDNEEEIQEVLRRIDDYVNSGQYFIQGEELRPLDYGDIAILCRSGAVCRQIQRAAEECGIPTYLQGDMEVMSSREGKLLLAWLRYLQNEQDQEGLTTILLDLSIPPQELLRIFEEQGQTSSIPSEISELRAYFLEKKDDLLALTARIFEKYGLSNDVTATILSIVHSCINERITRSDLIVMIAADIEKQRMYTMDVSVQKKATVIQTIHKAKGMEYPAVIIPRVDSRSFPVSKGDYSIYSLNEISGLRCKKVARLEDDRHAQLEYSWKYGLISRAFDRDIEEERRLMFVALSRAEQYITVIAGKKPSEFFEKICMDVQECLTTKEIRCSKISESDTHSYPQMIAREKEYRKIGVHSLLTFESDSVERSSQDGGMAFGTLVHKTASDLAEGIAVDSKEAFVPEIKGILESLKGAEIISEIECVLPIPELNVSLNGIIDLLVVYPDHVEVHDYKTDKSKRFEKQYKIQLSIYAHAAAGYYKLPVRCSIDYLRLKENCVFEPLSFEEIVELVKVHLDTTDVDMSVVDKGNKELADLV